MTFPVFPNKQCMFGGWLFNIGPHSKSPLGFEAVLDVAVECGFDGVAPGGFAEHLTPAKYDTPEKVAALLEMVARKKLVLGTLAADIWGSGKKWLTPEGRQAYVGAVKTNVDFAKSLGISGIRIDPNYGAEEIPAGSRHDALKAYVGVLKEVGQYAQDRSIGIHVESEPCWFGVNTVLGCRRLITEVNMDSVGLMWDLCHGNVVIGNPADPFDSQMAAIDKLSGLISAVHIADNLNRELVVEEGFDHPETGRHRPLGDGNVPITAVCQRLEKEARIAASTERTLDLCFYVGAYPDVLQQSLGVMRLIYPKTAA